MVLLSLVPQAPFRSDPNGHLGWTDLPSRKERLVPKILSQDREEMRMYYLGQILCWHPLLRKPTPVGVGDLPLQFQILQSLGLLLLPLQSVAKPALIRVDFIFSAEWSGGM